MSEDRIDFSALDPTRDSERFESTVRAISAAAGPQLAARRARSNVIVQVYGWWRPVLAAAAVIGVVSLGALSRTELSVPANTETEIGVAEAMGVPQQIAQWVRSDEVPTPAELLVTLESEQ
ncbi:MAG: hypothetical protein JSU87_07300 [Gemmatimonadota bacterium]|nr:MAG: hypothetical protein JSU87_07300 [Gemmatimonadota bacterium]